MLSSGRCQHTGIVNFYSEGDPLLAVGSVIEIGRPAVYHWRCYLGDEPGAGVAPDLTTAERRIASNCRIALGPSRAPPRAAAVQPAMVPFRAPSVVA